MKTISVQGCTRTYDIIYGCDPPMADGTLSGTGYVNRVIETIKKAVNEEGYAPDFRLTGPFALTPEVQELLMVAELLPENHQIT